MFEAWRQSGKEVAVIGLGKSGVSAVHLLQRHRLPVYASDAGLVPAPAGHAETLRDLGVAVDVGRHDLERIARCCVAVVSPGVPPEARPVAAARAAGVEVLAEAEVGLRALPGVPYLAVTGTNGKTTTTALTEHLLLAAGKRAVAAGNIGLPLCEVALSPQPPEWIAVELSSFQLHDMPGVAPAVGILTNLAPDHLDRYPTLEAYYADKARMFANATDQSVWISNADDAASIGMMAGVRGRHLRFSVRTQADAWYDRAGGRLMLGPGPLLPRGELQLLGDHNVANALAAALAVREAGATPAQIAEGLRGFRSLPHRMEPVGEVDGVLWINDSKATNIASTEVALDAVDRPFVLLLGGRHKGEPYTRLVPRLRDRCRAVVAYGEAKDRISADLGGAVSVVPGGTFDEVLAAARGLARRGDAVLLSPACSSYDMFQNYEERGAKFRAAVRAM